MAGLTIEEAGEVTGELVDAFARLIPQLSKSSPPPTADELQSMVDAAGTFLLLARLSSDGEPTGPGQGTIVGTLTLVVFRIPTAVRAWIEDVVVDEAAAGRGIGTALTEYALDLARDAGARTVDLTSRPSREAANHMYQRIGFSPRETNVYRFDVR
jgi:ribosomal protein S18 acetylase RimI-like enzyme